MLILFTIAGQIAMPWLVFAMASGFAGDERFALSVEYGRIAFPYIILISLTALLSGVLNSSGRFALAAAAPILMNVVMIALPRRRLAGCRDDIGLWQIWSVPVRRRSPSSPSSGGARPRGLPSSAPLPAPHAGDAPARRHGAGGARRRRGADQPAVGRQVGSFFDGAVAWLSYADRLYQLPLGVVGIAIGVVLLPDLSRRLGAGDGRAGATRSTAPPSSPSPSRCPPPSRSCVIPLADRLGPLRARRLRRRRHGPTALAVAVYGAGLPAFVMQKVISPLYYAREDTRTPFRFAVCAMVVNAVIALGLAPFIGFIAAALGTTIAGWMMLWRTLARRPGMGDAAAPDDRLRRAVPRILAACAAMAAALLLGRWLLGPGSPPRGSATSPSPSSSASAWRATRRRPRLRRAPARRHPRRAPARTRLRRDRASG